MNFTGWQYYNHAMIPTCAPHEQVNTDCIEDGSIWNTDRKPILARWTTDFDCGYETEWWYVINDKDFDITALKAKRRYEINRGIKNFNVKEIVPRDYADEIYYATLKAYESWPEKYRPSIEKDHFIQAVCNWNHYKTYGVFYNETNVFCGYLWLSKKSDRCIDFNVLRVIPEYEKYGINAAAVYKILTDHSEFIKNGGYICDGARSINHETAFQDYLEKYFGFRKAYCKLNIVYRPGVRLFIKIIYPFKKLLKRFDGINAAHQINGILKMEEIVKNQ